MPQTQWQAQRFKRPWGFATTPHKPLKRLDLNFNKNHSKFYFEWFLCFNVILLLCCIFRFRNKFKFIIFFFRKTQCNCVLIKVLLDFFQKIAGCGTASHDFYFSLVSIKRFTNPMAAWDKGTFFNLTRPMFRFGIGG